MREDYSHWEFTFCCSMMCGGTKSTSSFSLAAAEPRVFARPIIGMLMGMEVPCKDRTNRIRKALCCSNHRNEEISS